MGQITNSANPISDGTKPHDPVRVLLRFTLPATAVVALLLALAATADFGTAIALIMLAFLVALFALPLWAVILAVSLFRLVRRLVRRIAAHTPQVIRG